MNSVMGALPRYISGDTVKPGDTADVYRMGLLFGTIEVAEIRVAEDTAEVVDTRGRRFHASGYDFDLPAHDIDGDEQSLVGATLYHKRTGKDMTVRYNTPVYVKCADESGITALYLPDELTTRVDPLTALKNDLRAAADSSRPICAWFGMEDDLDCTACGHRGECNLRGLFSVILKRLEAIE